MPRDIEDLLLNTLVEVISTGTGISSGNIWLKMPETEYVNKRSGAHDDTTNESYLPSIGITYMKDAYIKHNNYGTTRYVRNSSSVTTQYAPLAELNLCLAIHLYAATHADINTYGTLLYQTLLTNRSVNYSEDTIQGEYFSIMFKSMKYVNYEKPIHKVFLIDCVGRILSETSGYVVSEVITNIDTYNEQESLTAQDDGYIVTGAIVTVTSDSSNPLLVDTEGEFEEGETERTEVL